MNTSVTPDDEKIVWGRASTQLMFVSHLVPLSAFWIGVRPVDWWICGALYVLRIFGITAGYHRYFAHRSYKMGRITQFVMAFIACTAAQKGPLWWAGIHVDHHKYSDLEKDPHSSRKGFWWCHIGWILCAKNKDTRSRNVKDWEKFPEIVWLNDWHMVPPILLGFAVWWFAGWSGLVTGFFLSTVLTWHGTFTINSVMHKWGRARYVTRTEDDSKNTLIFALLALGEGWHNNHHYYQSCTRQGFYWWEVDVTYYVIKVMSWLGLVWGIREPPAYVFDEHHENRLAKPA